MPKNPLAQSCASNKLALSENVPETFRRLPEIEFIPVPKALALDRSISHLARSIMLDWFARKDESEMSVPMIMIRFGLASELAEAVFNEMKETPYVR